MRLDTRKVWQRLGLLAFGFALFGALTLVNGLTVQAVQTELTVQFSGAPYSVNENEGTATITVSLSQPSTSAITVQFATGNGSAETPGDYLQAGDTLIFAPGETSKTFTVTIVNDALEESAETIQLTLSNPTGGATLGSSSMTTITIVDDDTPPPPPPTVQFSSSNYTVNEGGGTVQLTVSLSAASDQVVAVVYATSDTEINCTAVGTPTAGADYVSTNGTLVFAPGQTSQTFEVSIVGDTLDETDELFAVKLIASTNSTLGTSYLTYVQIIDDDLPTPTVQFSESGYSINEGGGEVTITATLSWPSGQTVTVAYAATNGTATDDDYTAISDTLSTTAHKKGI